MTAKSCGLEHEEWLRQRIPSLVYAPTLLYTDWQLAAVKKIYPNG